MKATKLPVGLRWPLWLRDDLRREAWLCETEEMKVGAGITVILKGRAYWDCTWPCVVGKCQWWFLIRPSRRLPSKRQQIYLGWLASAHSDAGNDSKGNYLWFWKPQVTISNLEFRALPENTISFIWTSSECLQVPTVITHLKTRWYKTHLFGHLKTRVIVRFQGPLLVARFAHTAPLFRLTTQVSRDLVPSFLFISNISKLPCGTICQPWNII